MNSRRAISIARWFLAFSALAGIVLVYQRWLHVNPATVAFTLLLFILLLAAKWGLRYAVAISITATACYNFFFLPPINTFTIADPQNWLALFAFLTTAIIASRLSERARDEAREARARQRELEVLFRLSREFLQSESTAILLSSIPSAVASVTEANFGMLYLLEGDRLYQAGSNMFSQVEIPHLRQLALSLPNSKNDNDEIQMPLRTGVRPKGLLLLRGPAFSSETADAIGSLVSISIDRAQALENVARGEASKESERLRTLMIDSVTHELRTPLTSIKGAATALLTGRPSEEDSRELLVIIDEESDRLNNLVSEAVEMAQLDTKQVSMHFGSINVQSLVLNAIEHCSWIKERHPLHVNAPENLQIYADAAFFQKALGNLLENAAKYSEPDTPITVTAEAQGEDICISVADRGIGIDASEQTLIFERFYRGRLQTGDTSGTGMGLAISRAIAKAHGGDITVTSQPGYGSVFTMKIPSSEASLRPNVP